MTDIDMGARVHWTPRRETVLLEDQIRGIDAWNVARRAIEGAEAAAASALGSRELRLDLARRMDVVGRQHQAVIDRTQAQMRDSVHLLRSTMAPRVVLAHRSDWFKDRISSALADAGINVVARLANGAEAVGLAIAEQPDLILVEDRLPMLSGEAVIRQVREFAPKTLAAAQVRHDWEIGLLLDAGARSAFLRRVPPADVARDLCELLSA